MNHIKQDLIKMNKVKTIKVERTSINENGEQKISKELYRYYKNGNLYKYRDSEENIDYIYNKNDLLILEIRTNKSLERKTNRSIKTYNYDKDNNLESEYLNGYIIYEYKDNKKKFYTKNGLRYTSHYNEEGLELYREYFCCDGTDKHIYEYNKDNKMTVRTSKNSRTEFYYYEDGRFKGLKNINRDDNSIKQLVSYIYEDKKTIIESREMFNTTVIIEYNDKELPIKYTCKDLQGNLKSEKNIEYTYYED